MRSALQSVLVAVLVLGALGSAGPAPTYSLLTDTDTASGSLTAASNFNGNSGGATADAGGPYTVLEGDTVALDGTGSTAQQGNIDSYDWQLGSGSGSVSPTAGSEVTYTAPADVDGDTSARVELTVDGSATDRATVTIADGDSGCGAASLSFCPDAVSVVDRDTSYAVTYQVDNPAGTDYEVRVRLERANNGQTRATTTSTVLADTLTVSENGNMNGAYNVRVELYDTSGPTDSRVDCRVATSDESDGIDPSVGGC